MAFRHYSADIKVLAVCWRLRGLPMSIIRRRLKRPISERSFRRWMTLYRHTRAVIRDPHDYEQRGRRRLLNNNDRQFMEGIIDENPSLFLDEIREKLYSAHGKMPSKSTIHLELRSRLLISLKKAAVSNVRKNIWAKLQWMHEHMNIPSHFMVFTDESAICGRDLLRVRQRAKIGMRTSRNVPKIHRTRFSLLPAISYRGILALSVVEGLIKRKRFERFLEFNLLPRMNQYPAPNSILVLDNASIHHGGRIRELCERKGVLLRYLPAYCPELNPIELGFNVLKYRLRRSQILSHTRNPKEPIRKAAMETFNATLTKKLYRRSGYRMSEDIHV